MANKITQENIIEINELYAKYGVKAKVARELGISAGTVSKYIIKDYVPLAQRNIKRFNGEIPELDTFMFCRDDWSILCELTSQERRDLEELQKEI